MIRIIYIGIFTIIAIVYIIFKSIKANEISSNNKIILRLTRYSILIKGIPAGLAAIFVLINRPDDSLFYFTLVIAFIFCFLGDLGMEKGLIPGLLLFLVAQILFTTAFVGLSLTLGITLEALSPSIIIILGMIIYLFWFIRYLESSENGLREFKVPVMVYCFFISTMLISSFLLWMISVDVAFGIVVLGALLFVISDSTIAVKEFHHEIQYREIKVMSSYYAAILLLSLSVLLI